MKQKDETAEFADNRETKSKDIGNGRTRNWNVWVAAV